MIKNQKLVDKIDPKLNFKQNLMTYVENRPVYQVEREGILYVLKPFNTKCNWERSHIQKERAVLQKAKDVDGITHLVHDYGVVDIYIAILKEFAEGEDLYNLGSELNNTKLQSQVEQTVKELHDLGFASMDLYARNIIIGPNEEYAKIIDLGHCSSKDDVPIDEFKRMKIDDINSLENLSR